MALDIDEWAVKVGALTPNDERYWFVRGIYGPYDAIQSIHMRRLIRPYVAFRSPRPVDVFLLSVGEPRNRDCTKIGGLPYLSRNSDWPRGNWGELLPFLAQFNFAESTDIAPDLPGDILLIFANPDFHDGIVLRWATAALQQDLVSLADVPVENAVPTYFGTRWRTTCYPEAKVHDDDYLSGITLPDDTDILSPYFLFEYVAMQIGAHPFEAMPFEVARPDEQFVCALYNVAPTVGRPYPFLNRSKPLNEDQATDYALYINFYADEDTFGALYILRSAEGTFRAVPRNL